MRLSCPWGRGFSLVLDLFTLTLMGLPATVRST